VARIAVPELPHLAIGVSIGLALPEQGSDAAAPARRLDALLSRADAALYRAKRNGRGRTEPASYPLRRVA
jgi:GGDEF domain-containing protein